MSRKRPSRATGGQTGGALAPARVLFALIMREMTTRFGRSAMGYLWAFIEPVGFIALLSLAFSRVTHSPPFGNSFPLFFATGYLAFSFYNDIASLIGRSVSVNRPLLTYPAVTPLDTVLARLVLQVLTGAVVAGVVFAGILAVFSDPVQITPVPLMLAFALGAFIGLGVGMVNITLFALSPGWEKLYGMISRPILFVSCIFYSFESLPRFAQEILWWNPIIHLVGLMRSGFYPIYDPAHVSLFYVFTLALGLNVAGFAMLAAMGNRLVEQ